MKGREDQERVVPLGAPPGVASDLPYAVELWNLSRLQPERVIGRAASALLARAIFSAAKTEYLERKIVLRRGDEVIAETP